MKLKKSKKNFCSNERSCSKIAQDNLIIINIFYKKLKIIKSSLRELVCWILEAR